MQLAQRSDVVHVDCFVVEVDPPVVCFVVELVPPAPPSTTVTNPLDPGEFQGVCWVSLGADCVSLGGPLGMYPSDVVPSEAELLLSQAGRTKPMQPSAMIINVRMNRPPGVAHATEQRTPA